METNSKEALWSIGFGSVPGPKRIRRATKNQDALAVKTLSDAPSSPVAAAVADGHGAARYVRSGLGSQIAANIAISELLSIAGPSVDDVVTMTDIKRAATERLPRLIHREWVDQVTAHYKEHPLDEKEREAIQSSGERSLGQIEATPSRMYGSTLLAVLLTEQYAVFVQLGDGEIVVAEQGADVQSVFEADPRALGDETASLASAEAWRDIQVSFHPFVERPPTLVLLTTDGYGKAFRTQDAFLQVGADMLALTRSEGFQLIEDELTSWLEEAAGISGDDATAVVIAHAASIDDAAGNPDGMTSAIDSVNPPVTAEDPVPESSLDTDLVRDDQSIGEEAVATSDNEAVPEEDVAPADTADGPQIKASAEGVNGFDGDIETDGLGTSPDAEPEAPVREEGE